MPKKTVQRKGWKTHQRNLKIKKKTKLGLIALGLLVILLILHQLINFIKLASAPLTSELSKNYTWNGEFNLNIVFRTNPIQVATYNPQEKRVTLARIPDETYIEVPSGYGWWQVRSIYDLGGGRLLKQSLSSFLGIPIDAIASTDLVDVFHRNLISGIELLPALQTDLTLIELIRFKIGLLQVRFDKIKEINLLELGVLDVKELADGTQVFVADPLNLDSYLTDFADPQIRSENLSIAIFNATSKTQLAHKAKRLITSLGGNVIVTQNAPYKVSKSYVEGEKSKTLDRLAQIFDQGCGINSSKCDKIAKEDLGPVSYRSQIIVVLGQEF